MFYRLVDLFTGALVPLLVVLFVFGFLKRAGAKKMLLVALFTLYFAEVLDIVGIPYIQTWSWKPIINLIPFSDLLKEGLEPWALFQFVANIVLFIPFGLLLPAIWPYFRRFRATVLAGVLVSLCIELAQLFSGRVTATDDVLMNTLGAFLGYAMLAAFAKKRWKGPGAQGGASGKHEVLELLMLVALAFASILFVKYALGSFIYGLILSR